ncbi:MAG: cell division protein FtsB [Dokdonella sp.]|nr:cell division protein FtsB [Dokdonella sp.]MCB1570167.1 cell division protein FtsB [Xanthomonadales bacterium]MCB1572920.1 cell division protein FtsB [Xanthomonadales bacterium]MCB1576235.1 cell division protein FtsB [Xanthomonadales bacterium]
MLRYVALLLLILLIALEVKLWVGQGGMAEVWRLEKSVADQKQENEALKARNDALAAEVANLKDGDEAIEERARSELGLVKPGEQFYQVVEPPADPARKQDGDR